ncbi:hypothetical protein Scani_82080 [Streptomyces caniferus]|uniref:Uncharacterized protein n=1 Tax=Streptomyces caniferus TaxID=285557 RepID=A0A640SLT3_9ACTN|nr:hypothetical protein Scani_82080 [Streptomyces caniferus]
MDDGSGGTEVHIDGSVEVAAGDDDLLVAACEGTRGGADTGEDGDRPVVELSEGAGAARGGDRHGDGTGPRGGDGGQRGVRVGGDDALSGAEAHGGGVGQVGPVSVTVAPPAVEPWSGITVVARTPTVPATELVT